MILERLVISNFRQFHGEQEIIFSKLKRKNVTIIHAENGFGKTALLNALLWGFYGHKGLTEKLENPESIINETMAHSGGDARDIEARVTIHFESNELKYILTRTLNLNQQRHDWRKAKVELEFQQDGETYPVDRPDWHIEGIMPHGISRFLFFDGEGIEHLAMRRNAGDITNAIHQMLGLKLLQKAVDDLNHVNVRGKLAKELRDNTDERTVKLIDSEKSIRDDLERLRTRLEANSDNRKANAIELESIGNALAANKEARELQQKREKLEADETAAKTKLREINLKLTSAIAEEGYTLFSDELVRKGREITIRLRNEGKMPAPVMNVFIEDLLEKARCICGCALEQGGVAREKVAALLSEVGDQHFNNAVGALDNALGVIEGVSARLKATVADATQEREHYKQQLRSIKVALDEIHLKLVGPGMGKEDEQVHQLEKRREELARAQDDLLRTEGKLQGEVSTKETELEGVRRQIESSEQQAAIAAKAQRRLAAVDEAVLLLQEILNHEMHDLRVVLNDEIDTHFKKIISKDYWAELSEDFILSIKKRIDTADSEVHIEVGKSGGEAQITALIFVASLVALARRRSELPTILKELEGGEYPMVMDSPFGQLGDKYRAGVAEWVPSLAPQVIIMVTSSQYKGPVEETLTERGRVGRRYLLVYHGPEKDKNATATVTLGGQRLTQYYKGKVECSEIRELDV